MFLMDYPYIRGEYFLDYAKNSPWNFLRAYIDSCGQRLFDEYPVDGVQAISRLKSQCANMTFSGQSRYNRLFQKLIHKGGESEINYIKIFRNSKASEISVVNSYSEYQLIRTFLEIFQPVGRYSSQIANHQS